MAGLAETTMFSSKPFFGCNHHVLKKIIWWLVYLKPSGFIENHLVAGVANTIMFLVNHLAAGVAKTIMLC